MKIGIARRTYRRDGGAEMATNSYIEAAFQLGYDVELATANWDGSVDERLQAHHIPISGSRARKSRLFRDGVKRWASGNSCAIYQSNEWADGVDVIRLGDGLHSEWLNILASQSSFGASLVRYFDSFHRDRLVAERVSLESQRLQKVIVNSRYIERQVLARYPDLEKKIEVIYNPVAQNEAEPNGSSGVSSAERHLRRGGPVIGFLGSGWARKGVAVLVKSLLYQSSDRVLLIGGRDSDLNKYKKLVSDLKLENRVRFLGVVHDKRAFFDGVDVLALPSLYDPCPNVCIEALRSGTPVVVSKTTGMADFEGRGGVYLCDFDIHSVVAEIERAIVNSHQKSDFAWTGQFDFPKFKSRVAEVYGGLV